MVLVAAAQISVGGSTEENLARILQVVASCRAEIICFPEIALCSEEILANNMLPEVAAIQRAAIIHRVNVIFGTYARQGQQLRNQVIAVSSQGRIIHRYSKRHLYITEEGVTPGMRNGVFELAGATCAVINCWDYAFPEDVRKLARAGAQLIFCPSYLMSHPRTALVLRQMPLVRAFDTLAYFIMVDAVAPETFKRSAICHPLRELASVEGKEGVIAAELNLSEIKELRDHFGTLKTRSPRVTERETLPGY